MEPTLLDLHLIFGKTPAGEDAVLQRTRLVQRNTRMVLILVDGNATVGELCEKTGNPQLTQQALIELESDGYVTRRSERESDAMMRDARASRRHKHVDLPLPPPSPLPPDAATTPAPDVATAAISQPTSDGKSRPSLPPASQPQQPLALEMETPPPMAAILGPESGTVFLPKEEASATLPSPALPAERQGVAAIVTRLRQIAAERAVATATVEASRRHRFAARITWPLAATLGIVFFGLLVFLLAVFFPYSLVVPELEAILAQRTGQPVRIGSVRVGLLPWPALVLSSVRIGDESNNLRVGELRVQPSIGNLFSSQSLLRAIELGNTELSPGATAILASSLETAASGTPRTIIERVYIARSQAALAGLTTGEMQGEVKMSTEGVLQSIALESPDHSLRVDAQRSSNGSFAIHVEGLRWSPSSPSAYVFDSLNLTAEMRPGLLAVNRFEFRIFDGIAQGSALVRAAEGATLTGEMRFERINLRFLGEALGIGRQLQGSADGRLTFSATSESGGDLLRALEGDGSFTASRGSLGGIDLPEAVRRAPTVPSTLGGETRFDRLSGAMRLSRTGYRFSRLALTAGLMEASGQLEVGRDAQLRGTMQVQMRGRADHSSRLVSLSGTLKTPQLRAAPPAGEGQAMQRRTAIPQ